MQRPVIAQIQVVANHSFLLILLIGVTLIPSGEVFGHLVLAVSEVEGFDVVHVRKEQHFIAAILFKRFVHIGPHGVQQTGRRLFAFGVTVELDDIVYAPVTILTAEGKLTVNGLNGTVEHEINQSRAFLDVQLLKLDVAGLQVIWIAVLHLSPIVFVEETNLRHIGVLLFNGSNHITPGVTGKLAVKTCFVFSRRSIKCIDTVNNGFLCLHGRRVVRDNVCISPSCLLASACEKHQQSGNHQNTLFHNNHIIYY